MNDWLIIVWIGAACVAMGVWESAVEGRNVWDKGKYGWKYKIGWFVLTRYHFFLFGIMLPMLLLLPLLTHDWSWRLFGVILSAYALGMSIEDVSWYIFNTETTWKEFGPEFATQYPWLKIGNFRMPTTYLMSIIVAIASWLIFWR